MVQSAHDMIRDQQRFPRRDRPRPGLSAKDAGVTLIYRPRDPNEESVCINGMNITQEGISHIGPHPELQKWVNKVLRVEVRVAKEKPTGRPKSATPVSAKDAHNTPVKRVVENTQVPVKRGAPPSAHEVIQSIRKPEAIAAGLIKEDQISAAQSAVELTLPEESETPNPDPVLEELDVSNDNENLECFGSCDSSEHPECAKCSSLEECLVEAKEEKVSPPIAPADINMEVALADLDVDVSIPTRSQIEDKYNNLTDLKEFASQYDLTGRGYASLMDKLISAGKVREN